MEFQKTDGMDRKGIEDKEKQESPENLVKIVSHELTAAATRFSGSRGNSNFAEWPEGYYMDTITPRGERISRRPNGIFEDVSKMTAEEFEELVPVREASERLIAYIEALVKQYGLETSTAAVVKELESLVENWFLSSDCWMYPDERSCGHFGVELVAKLKEIDGRASTELEGNEEEEQFPLYPRRELVARAIVLQQLSSVFDMSEVQIDLSPVVLKEYFSREERIAAVLFFLNLNTSWASVLDDLGNMVTMRKYLFGKKYPSLFEFLQALKTRKTREEANRDTGLN